LAVISSFLYLLKQYAAHSVKKILLENQGLINRNEADAVSGNLSSFEPGESYIDTGHDFSNDVDLFGPLSLFQYLNRTVTGYGRDLLAGWISDPFALSNELEHRQEAIKELASKMMWRQEFLAKGMNKELEKSHISGILRWMEERDNINSSSIGKSLIYALPLATIVSLFLLFIGILPYQVFICIVLLNLFYITTGLKKINRVHLVLSKKYEYLSSIDRLLKSFDNEIFTSEILNTIKVNISSDKVSANVAVKKLANLIQTFDSRLNILVSFTLNGLLLWDYHSIRRLEKWKAEYKDRFPVWLEMLGVVDAYISLGNYTYNNPDFVFPVISDKGTIFLARNLGHQLIDESKRVCNDFTLSKSGIVCIITGANMAGKSTFLRTIAINYILAMAGAPVCAKEMEFTPLKLFSSMRTADSLSHNESYFYAELKRLKLLKSRIESGESVFFILDEILKGTNSADKSLGSGLFLKKLLELNATGLIATHDTSLGDMENKYQGRVVNKCFEIEIDGEIIIFDYKLHEGVTQKMNAALLMRQMGILE
jgi:DNA mismatch repair ATPase MutS